MSVQRWAAEHSAKGAPEGLVLYDDDDDLFTVKTSVGWVTYSRDEVRLYPPLTDRDIDNDRGDQIVGQLETKEDRWPSPQSARTR